MGFFVLGLGSVMSMNLRELAENRLHSPTPPGEVHVGCQ